MAKPQGSKKANEQSETRTEIKIWGPIRMKIDERSNKLWGKIDLEALDKTLPFLDEKKLTEGGDLTRSDFYRVLEKISQSKESQPGGESSET